jgi:hypothetical protein
MSLALSAAPFNNDMYSSTNNSDNATKRKHNKTHRKVTKDVNEPNNKVLTVLEKIHQNFLNDDEDEDNDASYYETKILKDPPKYNEGMTNITSNNDQELKTLGKPPAPNNNNTELELNNYSNYGDAKTIDDYYKRIIPGYNGQPNSSNSTHQNQNQNKNARSLYPSNSPHSQDLLLNKLNYVITLLEDQQDERTNNVTEEVVLYSFLGIFIIFIADTFVRAGKYIR